MRIEKLTLINFKNFDEVSIPLHSKVNCFVGNNGVGKTNLLDAIYYLCMTKSYFQSSENFSIKHDKDFMTIQAFFNLNQSSDEIYCALKRGVRKQFRKNKKEYQKLSDHIGNYPIVMISPSDSSLITEGSEERRKYLNAVISQFDRNYLEDVIQYNSILAQRNKLLKDIFRIPQGEELLEVYDNQLIPLGQRIFEKRRTILNELTPVFHEFYHSISNGLEPVDIKYISQLENTDFKELLINSKQNDIRLQTTTTGIHKDDLELIMNNNLIRKIGSQGQQKTFLVALKMAQFRFLKKIKNITPILLLDDIFDKFDVNRVKQILHLVSDKSFGQIFITHTNESRMRELLSDFPDNFNLFRVENNNVTIINS